ISLLNGWLSMTPTCRTDFSTSSVGARPGGLPAERTDAAEALRRRNLLRHEDYCHFSSSEPADTGSEPPVIFADVQEEWRMAVISGNPEVLSAAARHWTQELSRRGVVTPEMLNSWKADALLLRCRLVRASLGGQSHSVLAAREGADALNPAPQPGGYSSSYLAWRDWTVGVLSVVR
ncbi:hypothetical protein AMQ83_14225, partial [Paenibacillus riograndensis]